MPLTSFNPRQAAKFPPRQKYFSISAEGSKHDSRPNERSDHLLPLLMPAFCPCTLGPSKNIFTDGRTWFLSRRYTEDPGSNLKALADDIRTDAKYHAQTARAAALKALIERPSFVKSLQASPGKIELPGLISKIERLTRNGRKDQKITKKDTVSDLDRMSLLTTPAAKSSFQFRSSLNELKKKEIDGSLFNERLNSLESENATTCRNLCSKNAPNEAEFSERHSTAKIPSTPIIISSMRPHRTQEPPRNSRTAFICAKNDAEIQHLNLNQSRSSKSAPKTPPQRPQPTSPTSPKTFFQITSPATARLVYRSKENPSIAPARYSDPWSHGLEARELDLWRRESVLAQRELALALREMKVQFQALGHSTDILG